MFAQWNVFCHVKLCCRHQYGQETSNEKQNQNTTSMKKIAFYKRLENRFYTYILKHTFIVIFHNTTERVWVFPVSFCYRTLSSLVYN